MAGSGFAVTNLQTLGYLVEATPGTAPSAAIQLVPVKTQDLQGAYSFMEPETYRSDRQVEDQVLVDSNPAGPIGWQHRYGVFDAIYSAAMSQAAWTTGAVLDNSKSVAVGSTTGLTVSSGGTAFAVGHVVRGSGWTNASNNTDNVVTASTGTTVTASGATWTTETAGAGKQFKVVGFQGASADITATASGLGSTTLDFTTLGLHVGQWIFPGGPGSAAGNKFATAALNVPIRITAIAAHALTCDHLPSGWATDAGTGKTIRVRTFEDVFNGTTMTSFTWERHHTDIAQFFGHFGFYPSTLSFTLTPGQILEAATQWTGLSVARSTATIGTGTELSYTNNPVMDNAGGVISVIEGTTVAKAKTLTWSIDNSLRTQKAVGTLGNAGVAEGTFKASVDFEAYFSSGSGATTYDKWKNSTETNITTIHTDTLGNYNIFWAYGKLTSATVTAGNLNSDVTLKAKLGCKIDPVSGYMAQISRLPV